MLVSVVIPAYEAAGTLRECLDALARQSYRNFQVILVDGSPDPAPSERIATEYPFVRYSTAAPDLGAHAKRNLGTRQADGGLLVFTDPDCSAHADWLQRLVDAHADGHAVVGGSVASLPDARNRWIHACKYGWWRTGAPAGPALEIPSANTSVTREAWAAHGPYREDRWAADSQLSWRVREAGATIWFEPRATVVHLDHGPWTAFLVGRFQRGSDFARTRAEALAWGRLQRIARALLFPFVPWVMTARAGLHARKAEAVADWLTAVPAQLLAHGCWAVGEAWGLLGDLFRDSGDRSREEVAHA